MTSSASSSSAPRSCGRRRPTTSSTPTAHYGTGPTPELRISFRELAGHLNDTGGPVVGRASVNPTGVGGSFEATLVDLEVDRETGKVRVLRFTGFQDVGTAIHPSYVEGQIQGGSAQGLGWALTEEYFMGDGGRMLNATFLDYRMPTSLDLPMIDAVIIEVPNPGHPYGVRGVGEASIVPTLAAFSNAMYGAVGVRMRDLPMSPDAVRAALSVNGRYPTIPAAAEPVPLLVLTRHPGCS